MKSHTVFFEKRSHVHFFGSVKQNNGDLLGEKHLKLPEKHYTLSMLQNCTWPKKKKGTQNDQKKEENVCSAF